MIATTAAALREANDATGDAANEIGGANDWTSFHALPLYASIRVTRFAVVAG